MGEIVDSSDRLGWRAVGGAVAGVIGAVAVVVGVGFAVYSRWFASTTSASSERLGHPTFFSSDSWGIDIAGLPSLLAVTAVGLGTAVLIALGFAVLRIARGWTSYRGYGFWCAAAVVATVVVWPALVLGDHADEVWDKLRLEYPLSVQLPAALGAGTLIFAGAILLMPTLKAPNRIRQLPRRAVAVAAAAGVALSAGTVVVAVRAGDDGLHVDHITATRVAVPALPSGLGPEKYRFAIPATETNSGAADIADLVAAGTGFILSSPEGITAYDGVTGAPRWHYLRTHTKDRGNHGLLYQAGSLRPLDGGAVVLAEWATLGWTAFDAVTGEILWQKTDFTRDYTQAAEPALRPALGVPGPWRAAVPLILVDDNRIRGYDARTGARRWSTAITDSDARSHRVETVVTDTAIYRLAACSDDTSGWVTLTVLDAHSGAIVASRELDRHPTTDRYDPFAHLEALTNSVLVTWSFDNRQGSGTILLRTPAQLATATPLDRRSRQIIAADPAGPDVVISDYWTHDGSSPDRFAVLDTETGAEKYTLVGMEGWGKDPGHDLFLPDQIIETSYSAGQVLQAWSRADGRLLGSQPIAHPGQKCSNTPLRAVPGALLAVCVHKTTAELVGYPR